MQETHLLNPPFALELQFLSVYVLLSTVGVFLHSPTSIFNYTCLCCPDVVVLFINIGSYDIVWRRHLLEILRFLLELRLHAGTIHHDASM